MAAKSDSKHRHHRGVVAIAILKLVKGILLLLVALGALSLLHQNVREVADHVMRWLHLDPEGDLFDGVLQKVSGIDDKKLKQISGGGLFYCTLLLTEGVGLLMEKRWAEWLTIFVTSSFIPFEIYELTKHVSAAKIVVLILNVAIVIYLIFRLRDKQEKKS